MAVCAVGRIYWLYCVVFYALNFFRLLQYRKEYNGILARFFIDYGRSFIGRDFSRPRLCVCVATGIEPSKRIGLISSLGVALGLGVHILYSVLGMAALIASAA